MLRSDYSIEIIVYEMIQREFWKRCYFISSIERETFFFGMRLEESEKKWASLISNKCELNDNWYLATDFIYNQQPYYSNVIAQL